MDSADYPEMFYARQVINNACGTQALLSVLLNIKDDGVDLGKTLQNFQEFASALDAETRGKFAGSQFWSRFDVKFWTKIAHSPILFSSKKCDKIVTDF